MNKLEDDNSSFCRLCLEDEDLYKEGVDPALVEEILRVDIYKRDATLLCLCKACGLKLNETRIFWETIIKTQQALKNYENEPLHVDDVKVENNFEAPSCSIIDPIAIENAETNLKEESTEEYLVEQLDEDTDDASENETEEYVEEERLDEDFDSTLLHEVVISDVGDSSIMVTKVGPDRFKKSQSTWTPEERSQHAQDERRVNEFYKFTCLDCEDVTLPNFNQYKMHRRNKHREAKPFIRCCKRKLVNFTAMVDHLDLHMNPEKLTCRICKKTVRDSYQMKIHMDRHYDPFQGRYHECDVCHKRFFHQSLLKTHKLTHMTPEELAKISQFECEHCNKMFPVKAYRDHHVRLKHLRVYEQQCKHCSKSFKTKAELRTHIEGVHTSSSERTEQCPQCDARFTTPIALRGHIKRQHDQAGLFTCEECSKEFRTLTALKNHINYVHMMDEKYVCRICNRGFKKRIGLTEHMPVHYGGFLYECAYCDKRFNSNANMYSHKKRLHPEEMERERSERDQERGVQRKRFENSPVD